MLEVTKSEALRICMSTVRIIRPSKISSTATVRGPRATTYEKVVPGPVNNVVEMTQFVHHQSVKVKVREGIGADVLDVVGSSVLLHTIDISPQLY